MDLLNVTNLVTIKLRSHEDIVKARQRARQLSHLLGFELSAQTRVAAAVSEIARNAYQYAGSGTIEFKLKYLSPHRMILEIQVNDQGPGIKQLQSILSGQYNSCMGGKGITGTRNIVDHFNITSNPGKGTQVTMAMNIPITSLPITQQTIAKIVNELARYRPSSATDEIQQQNQELLQALDLLSKARNELETRVQERTAQLSQTNETLQIEVKERIVIAQSLQDLTRQLHLALQAARMGTWAWDLEQHKVMVDDYLPGLFSQSWQYNTLDLEQLLATIYPDDQEKIRALVSPPSLNMNTYDVEFRIIWPDKSIHYLASRGELHRNLQQKVIQLTGVCWDITERRKAEEWLHHHQKELAQVSHLTLMGEMGSILAHELNQPLTVITTFTQGCIRRLKKNQQSEVEKMLEMMEVVAKQAERAGQVIHSMKDMARKNKHNDELVSISDLIQEAISLMQYEMRNYTATIGYKPIDHLPLLVVDKIQIEQVLINLMRNALEAMQEVQTKNPHLEIALTLVNNTHAAVTIIDNGPGFSADLATKLLEPYYTTKSHGMGLGLAISRSIIEAHGGQLKAKASLAGGACFEFTLPLART